MAFKFCHLDHTHFNGSIDEKAVCILSEFQMKMNLRKFDAKIKASTSKKWQNGMKNTEILKKWSKILIWVSEYDQI